MGRCEEVMRPTATKAESPGDFVVQFRRLIAWAIRKEIVRREMSLPPYLDIEDLIQEASLRLLKTFAGRELPNRAPSYVVRAARRVVSDLQRSNMAKRNNPEGGTSRAEAYMLMGIVRHVPPSRIRAKNTWSDRNRQARDAAKKRWQGKPLTNDDASRAKHAEAERRRRARRKILARAAELGVGLEAIMVETKRKAMTKEERRARQRAQTKTKRMVETEEQKENRRMRQREYMRSYRAAAKAVAQ